MNVSETDRHDAILKPVALRGFADLPPFAVMVGNPQDLQACGRRFGRSTREGSLFSSRISRHEVCGREIVLAGPMLGAPQAAMILETLIAGGVEQILYAGWCGSVVPGLRIGDIVLPVGALINEGTSPQYQKAPRNQKVQASESLRNRVARQMAEMKIPFCEGIVWTTDAIFRETKRRVAYFRSRGAVAVEMETAALFSIGRFRHVHMASILAVSDELSSGEWKPGFKAPAFEKSRRTLMEVVERVWKSM